MRLEQEVDIFGDAEIIRRLQANETSISVLQGNISALISASELTELQNSHTTMYSQLASLKLTVNSMDLEFSDLRTEFNTVSGQYTELDSKVAQYKASVDGLSISITEVQQNLVDNYSTTSAVTAAINAKANEIELSVSGNYPKKDQIISAINLSPEDVSISASKIKLEGIITANGNFKILADGSMETIAGKIGGWTISGNNLMDDRTDFLVRIAAPTVYGGDGNGNADVLVVRDKTNDTYPLVISSNGQVLATKCKFEGGTIGGWKITETDIYNDNGASSAGIGKAGTTFAFWAGATYANRNDPYIAIGHAGEFFIKDYLTYLPNGMGYDANVKMTMGGWQIKTGTNAWGYDHFEYWDTIETQENGICAHGPWVVWGGWNGGPSVNVENYKFVVTDQGVCKAMSWVTGSRVEWKENIVPYTKSALQEIANSEVYYYDLKDRGKGGWKEGRHIGFVIGDGYSVSQDILDGGGGAIDMYSALAIAYKAIQEQQKEIEELKKKIKEVAA